MWRKKAELPEQGRVSRQSPGQGGSTFSYYRNTDRAQPVRSRAQRDTTGKLEAGEAPRRRLRNIPFWLLVVVVIICAGKVLILSTQPKVVIVGKTDTTSDYGRTTAQYAAAAHASLAGSIANRNKLTVDLSGTARQLRHAFPELQAVSVTLPLVGNRPIVYVQLAQPSLVLQAPSGNYALNSDGIVLAKLQTVPDDVPLVVDESTASTPHPGSQLLPGTTVAFIVGAAQQYAAAKMAVSTFVLPANAPYEIDVRFAGESYTVRMNLVADVLEQSGAVIATVQQKGKEVSQYLDVRVPERVYYK